MNNEPQKQEGNMMDSVFGDGTKPNNASDPLETVRGFFGTLFTFGAGAAVLNIAEGAGEVISNALGGGLEVGAAPALNTPTPALNVDMGIKNPSMGMS